MRISPKNSYKFLHFRRFRLRIRGYLPNKSDKDPLAPYIWTGRGRFGEGLP